jgi:hypothetical protein
MSLYVHIQFNSIQASKDKDSLVDSSSKVHYPAIYPYRFSTMDNCWTWDDSADALEEESKRNVLL